MDNMLRFRDMVANNAVAEIWDETRKLADVYGIDGAILYLLIDKGVTSSHPLQTAGGVQQMYFVNEDGLAD